MGQLMEPRAVFLQQSPGLTFSFPEIPAMDQCVRVILNSFSEVAGGSENIIQCLCATLKSSWVKCHFNCSSRFSLFRFVFFCVFTLFFNCVIYFLAFETQEKFYILWM